VTPGRLAAKNLQIDNLPLLILPHPLNDLNPEEVRDMARLAYPVVDGVPAMLEEEARRLNSDDPLLKD